MYKYRYKYRYRYRGKWARSPTHAVAQSAVADIDLDYRLCYRYTASIIVVRL